MQRKLIWCIAVGWLLWPALTLLAQEQPPTPQTLAGNAVRSGSFIVEMPTLENLGFEWFISGDANRTASVSVQYREKGQKNWRKGLPMFRLQGERVDAPSFPGALSYVAPNMFAGSIFDLKPGTTYEAVFRLTAPDGVTGEAPKKVTVKTRSEPQPAVGGRTFHVY